MQTWEEVLTHIYYFFVRLVYRYGYKQHLIKIYMNRAPLPGEHFMLSSGVQLKYLGNKRYIKL